MEFARRVMDRAFGDSWHEMYFNVDEWNVGVLFGDVGAIQVAFTFLGDQVASTWNVVGTTTAGPRPFYRDPFGQGDSIFESGTPTELCLSPGQTWEQRDTDWASKHLKKSVDDAWSSFLTDFSAAWMICRGDWLHTIDDLLTDPERFRSWFREDNGSTLNFECSRQVSRCERWFIPDRFLRAALGFGGKILLAVGSEGQDLVDALELRSRRAYELMSIDPNYYGRRLPVAVSLDSNKADR